MMMSYVGLISIYLAPAAVFFLLTSITFSGIAAGSRVVAMDCITSPFLTLQSIPLTEVLSGSGMSEAKQGSWTLVLAYFVTTLMLIVLMSGSVFFSSAIVGESQACERCDRVSLNGNLVQRSVKTRQEDWHGQLELAS